MINNEIVANPYTIGIKFFNKEKNECILEEEPITIFDFLSDMSSRKLEKIQYGNIVHEFDLTL